MRLPVARASGAVALAAMMLAGAGAGAAARLATAAEHQSNPTAAAFEQAVAPRGAGLAEASRGTTALTPEGPYTANYVADTVMIVDRGNERVAARVSVGSEPFVVATSRDGSRLYVINRVQDLLSVLDATTHAVLATVLVGRPRLAVAAAPADSRLYIGNFLPDTVIIVDTVAGLVLATIPVRGLVGDIAVNAAGTRAYVGSFEGEGLSRRAAVSVIDIPRGQVATTIPIGAAGPSGGARIGLAVDPAGRRLYAADSFADTVVLVDTATDRPVATVPTGRGPDRLVVSPDGTRLYVANTLSSTISVLDTSTNAVVDTVPVSGLSTGDGVAALPDELTALAAALGTGGGWADDFGPASRPLPR